MSVVDPRVSRRRFLGGSMVAAAGALSAGVLQPRFAAAQMPVPAVPLSSLRLTGTPDEAYWWKVRSQFNLIDGLTFLNNGTAGPTPRVVLEANERYFREVSEDPTNNYRREGVDVVRERIARFVGATADEIAVTRSTTEGMNIFAHGLDWREGDEVLMVTHEHGGGINPYRTLEKRRGIKIVMFELPSPAESVDQIVGLYEKHITPRTRVIMVSHMMYVTGLLAPVKELSEMAHRRGLLISVDGAHPLGMVDLNFHDLGCDHYSAAGQKWLLAGTGTGVCYVKRDVQEQIYPLMGAPGDPERGARKYEAFGQRHVPSALGMGEAVEFQETIGKRAIEARVRSLSDRLRRGLAEIPGVKLWTPNDPKLAVGLTLFSVRDVPMDNVQQAIMGRDRIYIRTMGTGNLNAVRASTHLYNFPEEVDRLIEAVKHVAENSARYMQTAAA